jgi:hypothetical protein
MTDKASPEGWVVQVTVAGLPAPSTEGKRWVGPVALGAPSFQYFNVAAADANKAVEATSNHLARGEADDQDVRAVRRLSSAELATLSLKPGQVKPA